MKQQTINHSHLSLVQLLARIAVDEYVAKQDTKTKQRDSHESGDIRTLQLV